MNRCAARMIERRLRDSKQGIWRRHIHARGSSKMCMGLKVSSFIGRRGAQQLFCEPYVMLDHLDSCSFRSHFIHLLGRTALKERAVMWSSRCHRSHA